MEQPAATEAEDDGESMTLLPACREPQYSCLWTCNRGTTTGGRQTSGDGGNSQRGQRLVHAYLACSRRRGMGSQETKCKLHAASTSACHRRDTYFERLEGLELDLTVGAVAITETSVRLLRQITVRLVGRPDPRVRRRHLLDRLRRWCPDSLLSRVHRKPTT